MLKRISLRIRITLVSVLLLLFCCIGLTFLLNISAYRMADVIEAVPVQPAIPMGVDSEIIGEPAQMMTPVSVSMTARQQLLGRNIFFMVCVVLVGGVLTYFITGRALRPLGVLSQQMKNKTVHNLSQRLPVPESHDEVASLTASFNDMSEKLGESFATQKRFSQSAAHELRTPLAVIKTKLEVFRKKQNRSLKEYDMLFSLVEQQTDRLSMLCKDLLNLTSVDGVALDEEIDMECLLSEITGELSNLAEEQGMKLHFSCPSILIKGNLRLLYQAFYNLLENAIKYSAKSGTVSLTGEVRKDSFVVTVSDNGIGIPADKRELIFEPFYRVDKSRSRQMGGAGLGLSTVKSILERHGAAISVADNPGGGSIFTVTLVR